MTATCQAMTAGAKRPRAASGSSPDRTWRVSPPSCARTRWWPCWPRWAPSCRRPRPMSASSTGCSRASARPTTSPAGVDLHGRDGRDRGDPQPGGPRALVSSTRSAAARRPSTASPSPGRRWSTCTRPTAAARSSPPISHELTVLSRRLPRLSKATMRVKEWRGDVIFLHEVGRGRRRPFLRHPGGEARGASPRRGRARAAGSGGAGRRPTAPPRRADDR